MRYEAKDDRSAFLVFIIVISSLLFCGILFGYIGRMWVEDGKIINKCEEKNGV